MVVASVCGALVVSGVSCPRSFPERLNEILDSGALCLEPGDLLPIVLTPWHVKEVYGFNLETAMLILDC